MDLQAYRKYIEYFTSGDRRAFVDYFADDVVMQNGGTYLRGLGAVLEHYEQRIWPYFRETLKVGDIASDSSTAATMMSAHFEAVKDAETVFGKVRRGDQFDYNGVIFYNIRPDNRFSHVYVAYLSFTATPLGGSTITLPIPH